MDHVEIMIEIPKVVVEAYSLLLQHRIVTIAKPITPHVENGAKGWAFECISNVPYPNEERVPERVRLRVEICEGFPRKPVKVFAICDEVRGFPHQDAESGKLCLLEEQDAPRDASRLVCYVKWAIEWLEDAANGTLLNEGDPYELPDFSRKLLVSQLPTKSPFVFDESSISYEDWKSHICKFGNIQCCFGIDIEAIFACKFSSEDGSLIRSSEFNQDLLSKDKKILGHWLLVPDIRYLRHRPPQTYGELKRQCDSFGVDFYGILKRTWNLENLDHYGILLIGFPIPKMVGDPPEEIHWQPLFIRNLRWFQSQTPTRGSSRQSRRPNRIWQRLLSQDCFSPSQQLPWGKVENVTRERLYARGAHPSSVQSTGIAFFGCGALGSSVAELLARGGVNQLSLFDPDSLMFGNLCRHSLDGSSVNLNKAEALAKRLLLANPLSSINGYPQRLPPTSDSEREIRRLLDNASLLVDCTTSEVAFEWLDQYALEECKRLVSIFFNFQAELLTICISGESTSCRDVYVDLNHSVQRHQTAIDAELYFRQPPREEQVIEGAGCWHPSFPALYGHVQILAAHAVDFLSSALESNEAKGLAAIVRRRSSARNDVEVGSIVEIAWKKEYP